MQIRILEKDNLKDKLKTRKLYEMCFDKGKDEYIDYYYDVIIKRNIVVALFDDSDNVISMVHLNPYLYNVYGKEMMVHYLVAIATDEAYRHRGYMKMVLTEASTYLNEHKEPFCYLVPENVNMEKTYERLGFKKVCQFTIDKFSKDKYDIFPVETNEYKDLMKWEDYYLKLDTDEYRDELSKKPVMFKLLYTDDVVTKDYDSLLKSRIYVCQEV